MNAIDSVYSRFVDERFPLPTENEVKELETKLGVVLPPKFRGYLLEYNGGVLNEPDIIMSDPNCPRDRLTVLYGIRASHRFADLRGEDKNFAGDFPATALSIGYTVMGNLLLLLLQKEAADRIVMKTAYEETFCFLADSIESLCGCLQKQS